MYRLLVLCFVFIFVHDLPVILAQVQVPLKFYTDHQCKTPSTENATASVPISQCIITPGLGSVSHQPVVCTSGTVQLIAYADTSCGTQIGWYNEGNQCGASTSGAFAATLFTCNQMNGAGTIDPGTPTSSTTIAVAPVADSGPTASTAPSATKSSTGTPTPTAPSSSPPRSSSSGGDGTTGNSTAGAGGNSTPSPSPLSGHSGLSTSDTISIAVGLGVGIPTIIIMLCGLICCRRRS